MKKVLCILLVMVLASGFNVMAMEKVDDHEAYEEIVYAINDEFGLDLELIDVDMEQVSIIEFESIVRGIAVDQSKLLNHVESKADNLVEHGSLNSNRSLYSTQSTPVTKSRNIWGSYGSYFKMEASFNVSGNQVSNLNFKRLYKTASGILSGYSLFHFSSPSYSYIDGGRTGTISMTATLSYNTIQMGNISVYCEFYYSD